MSKPRYPAESSIISPAACKSLAGSTRRSGGYRVAMNSLFPSCIVHRSPLRAKGQSCRGHRAAVKRATGAKYVSAAMNSSLLPSCK